jgi:catechol 2,3-dioxygenase-like lactoylglutathione lyase family enzyme
MKVPPARDRAAAMSVTGIEHVLVLSDDIDLTRDFYCGAVGLQLGERPPLEFPGFWLYAGAVPCLHVADRRAYLAHAASIGLAVSPEPAGAGPVDHIAFSADDYDAVCTRVERAGVSAVRNMVPGAGLRQVFIDDPNGVRVEINVKSPPTEAR